MEKIWNISGDNSRNITAVSHEILIKYSDSLHESQDKIISKVQVLISDSNQALLKFNIHSAKTDKLLHKIFSLTVMDNEQLLFNMNYYNNKNITNIISIDELDSILEEIIQSDDMGITIAHLISIA